MEREGQLKEAQPQPCLSRLQHGANPSLDAQQQAPANFTTPSPGQWAEGLGQGLVQAAPVDKARLVPLSASMKKEFLTQLWLSSRL